MATSICLGFPWRCIPSSKKSSGADMADEVTIKVKPAVALPSFSPLVTEAKMSRFLTATAFLFLFCVTYSASYATFDYCNGTSWIRFKGFCYLFQTKDYRRMSYYDAEDFCRSEGAHLVSIHSEEENEFVLNTMGKGFGGRKWIGLNILDGDNKPRWSDDSPVTYQKRVKKEFYKGEKCFMMYITERIFGVVVGGWRPEHCALHYAPICKRPEGAQPTVIPPPTTEQPVAGHCPAEWIQFGEKCYKFFGKDEKDRVQYKDARSACWKIGADSNLVAIHSMEEQAFLTQHLYDLGTSAWIGINKVESDEIGHDIVFGWVDNSRNDFEFWTAGHPPPGTWKYCGRLSYEGVNKGQWIADYCEISKRGYICQRPTSSHMPKPTPEPPKCKEGFQGYRNACYQYQVEPQTPGKAEEKCQELGGHVTSVVDSFEQAFLYNYVIKERKSVGIGLITVEGTKYFRWTDKQPFYFSIWSDGQPRLTASKSCVIMDATKDLKWNVTDCSKPTSYVCKTTSDVPPKFPEVLGTCSTNDSSWIDIGDDFCYHVADSPNHVLSWDHASRYCMIRGMKMISVHSDHTMNSLLSYLWKEARNVLLGLVRTFDKKSFMWVDGTPLNYTNWADREPSSWSSSKDCVAFSTIDGKWSPVECSDGGVTICQANKVKNVKL